MTQKTVLTDTEINRLQMILQVMLNDPSGFHRVARAIEQEILSSTTESRTKHYGDGYEDGWNSALEEAAKRADSRTWIAAEIRDLKTKEKS